MWWGRILGMLFGAMFAKVIGAIIGFYLGYLFDKGARSEFERAGGFTRLFNMGKDASKSALFFESTFSIMGHIAKANGRITKAHIQTAQALMDELALSKAERAEAQDAYREGKEATFPFKDAVEAFKESVSGRRDMLMVFLEIQARCAMMDGKIIEAERQLLGDLAQYLGFSPQELEVCLRRTEAQYRFHQQQQAFEEAKQQAKQSSHSQQSTHSRQSKRSSSQSSQTDQASSREYHRREQKWWDFTQKDEAPEPNSSRSSFDDSAWEERAERNSQKQSYRQRRQSSQQQQRKQQRPHRPNTPSLDDAYRLLGVSASINDKELKKAYRRLMQQNHPDKLISKGLPKSMMELAKQKTQDIQSAYELIIARRK